jgi:transcriptional regulator with XRE-family HTH domain
MFSENLIKYRKKLGLSRQELAHRLNRLYSIECTGSTVQSWERGTNPKIEVIVALADVLGIPEQFLFNDSDHAVNKVLKEKLPQIKPIVENTVPIELVNGYIGAGSAGHLVGLHKTYEYFYIDSIAIDKKYRNKDLKALVVIGDSMEPYVSAGDIVIFYELQNIDSHIDGKYVITTSSGTMVKNLKFKINGDIVISSCNKIYQDELINFEDSQEYLDINGMVVGRILKS